MNRILKSNFKGNLQHQKLILGLVFYSILFYFLALYLDIFNSGFSDPDESSHFINTYFFWDFLKSGNYFEPMKYAENYYISFPKLAIGHWPPLYYLLSSFFFFIIPATGTSIMLMHFFISLSASIPILILIIKISDVKWALIGVGLYLFSPLSIEGLSFYLLDQPLVLLTLLSVLVWYHYTVTSKAKYIILYSLIVTIAIYTKGNGWFLGLMPCFHIILGNHWDLLKKRRTYIAGLLCLLLVTPWYYLTTKITSDGFNYSFGINYAVSALQYNLKVLIENIGLLGSVLSIYGVISLLWEKENDLKQIGIISLSAALAVLIFHSLVPVALASRYMMTALPFIITLEVMGLIKILRLTIFNSKSFFIKLVSICIVMSLFYPGFKTLFLIKPEVNLCMDQAAKIIIQRNRSNVILIDGNSGGEGAFIAELLMTSDNKKLYIVRSSKLLSESDFMGNKYQLKVDSIDQTKLLLKRIGVNTIVLERQLSRRYFPHSELLLKTLESPESGYERIMTFNHKHREGKTFIFVSKNEFPPDLNMVYKVNCPTKKPAI